MHARRDASSRLGYLTSVFGAIRVKRTYPLGAVEIQRETRADARAREVSRAERRVLEARAEEARAAEALQKARAARHAMELEARQRLETGVERAIDLERSFVFSETGRVLEGELESERIRVARRSSEAERARAGALACLSTAHAEVSAVTRHHAQWSASREREQQEKEEDAALEQWNSERLRRSGL